MKEILSLFLDSNLRYGDIQLSQDHLGKPIIFATDGCLLAYVQDHSEDYKNTEYDVSRITRNLNISKVIDLSIIDINKYKVSVKEEIECVECCGHGIVEYEYYAESNNRTYEIESDCPVCNGKGFIGSGKFVESINSNAALKIYKKFIPLIRIEKIISASKIINKEIELCYYNEEENNIHFKIGNLIVIAGTSQERFGEVIDLG